MKFLQPKRVELAPGEHVPNHLIVDDPLWDAVIERVKRNLSRPLEEVADFGPAPEIDIDGGGMVHSDEPVITVDLDGTKVSCFARQIEFILPKLDQVREHDGWRGVWVGGRWWGFVFTEATASRLKVLLASEAANRKAEIDEWWAKMDASRVVRSADGQVRAISLSREQQHEIAKPPVNPHNN